MTRSSTPGAKNPRDSAETQASAHNPNKQAEHSTDQTHTEHAERTIYTSITHHAVLAETAGWITGYTSITHHAVLAETAGWITGPPIRPRAPLDALRI